MPISIPMSWLYILPACISFEFVFIFGKQFDVVHVHYMFDLFLRFTKFVSAENFLSIWLNVLIAIINSNGDRASPWNIFLGIFVSAKLFPPAANSTLQVFMFYFDKVYILHILRQFIIHVSGTITYAFCRQSRPLLDFFLSPCCCWVCADQCRVVPLCLWIFYDILSVPRGTNHGLLARNKSFPIFAPLVFST